MIIIKKKVLYKKLENILVDKLKNYHHEKIQYTKNYIMNFPHITKEIIVKTFDLQEVLIMVIKNVYKKGFITTSLMNETSTWEQQIFYANQTLEKK